MFASIRNLFRGSDRHSKSAAKSRLQFVLVQDRAGLTTEEMTAFKQELLEVIERYFEIDHHGFDIDYQRSGESTTLLINSPVIVRRASTSDASNGTHVRGQRRGKGKKARTDQATSSA